MKIFKVITCLAICSIAESATISVLLPSGNGREDVELLSSYIAPYKKFWPMGLFANDKRLEYTISQSLLENDDLSCISKSYDKSALDLLVLLSENHWIAIMKRDLLIAKKIAFEMGNIMLGKYGLAECEIPSTMVDKISEFRFRCIEQIEMSLPKKEDFDPKAFAARFENGSMQYKNAMNFASLFELAMRATNTPLMFQSVSYEFSLRDGVPNNAYEVTPVLKKNEILLSTIVGKCCDKYKDQSELILKAYKVKKSAYVRYLQDLLSIFTTEKMRGYRAVDRGQTSAGHHSTCMFNSVFYQDVSKNNVKSTKIGSINSAKEYIQYLNAIYGDLPEGIKAESALLNPTKINGMLSQVARNSSAEAVYAYVAEIYNGKIFPGVLADCSALEIQCHALKLNLAIFPKANVRAGNSLFSFFGSGFFGSENFAIAPVSCTYGHAQSLVVV